MRDSLALVALRLLHQYKNDLIYYKSSPLDSGQIERRLEAVQAFIGAVDGELEEPLPPWGTGHTKKRAGVPL